MCHQDEFFDFDFVKSRQKFCDFGTGKYLGRVNILNLDKNDYFICSSQMVKVIIILEEVVGFLIACQDILKLISRFDRSLKLLSDTQIEISLIEFRDLV